MTQKRKICCICQWERDAEICDECWHEAQHRSAQRQEEALAAGRRAAAEGRPVIYIHGRAYLYPADAQEHEEQANTTESPFPWDIWTDTEPPA